jgi:archaetidylinositol phosphate synthase
LDEINAINKRARQEEFSKRYIDRPVDFLIKHNFSPNLVSYIGFTCSLIAAFLIAIRWIYFSIWFAWILPFIVGLGGAFDLFDGEVARRTNRDTKAGAFLDSNLDRISDAVSIIALIYGKLINYILGYFILFLVIMISYTRSRAENEGVNMKGVGFMERAERVIFLLVALILEICVYYLTYLIMGKPFVFYIPFISSMPVTPVLTIFIIVFTIMLFYTVSQRVIFTFKTLRNQNNC